MDGVDSMKSLDIRNFVLSLVKVFRFLVGTGERYMVKTEQYPDRVSSRTPQELPPNTRGILVNDLKVCNGCGDCGPMCPTGAIDMDTKTSNGEIVAVERFAIDLGKCVYCGYCVEICPVYSISFTKNYEHSGLSAYDLIIEFTPEEAKKGDYEQEQKLRKIRSYEVSR